MGVSSTTIIRDIILLGRNLILHNAPITRQSDESDSSSNDFLSRRNKFIPPTWNKSPRITLLGGYQLSHSAGRHVRRHKPPYFTFTQFMNVTRGQCSLQHSRRPSNETAFTARFHFNANNFR